MKTLDEKKRFIELRASGLSYDKISKELKISKPTLIGWGRECEKDIANLQFLEMDSLIEECKITRYNRIKKMALILGKALDELENRTFKKASTKELLSLIHSLDEKIKSETSVSCYFTGEYPSLFNEDVFPQKEHTLPFLY